jgi:hypothetical protein
MARLLSGLLLTSAADSWCALARCVGERFGSVVGQRMTAPCPLRDRPCHGVRPQRDEIWRRSRDVRLLCCVRLEPLVLSGNVRGRLRKLSEVGFGSSQPKKRPRSASREPTTDALNNRSAGHEAQNTKRGEGSGINSFVLEAMPIFRRSSLNRGLAFDIATIIGLGVELFGQFAKIGRRREI